MCVDLKLHEPGSKNRKVASTPPPRWRPHAPAFPAFSLGLLVVVVARQLTPGTGAELGKWREGSWPAACMSKQEGGDGRASSSSSLQSPTNRSCVQNTACDQKFPLKVRLSLD
jgi:hypothetical protein